MAKKTKEEAKAALATAKEEAKAARMEKRAFEKENDLAKDEDHSAHEKFGKKWTKLNEVSQKKAKKVEEAESALKEVKSVKTPRPSKYEYPAEIKTAQEKKRYRAKMRAEKNKADKPKKEKKADKAEKSEKTSKKAKKEKEAVPVED